MVDMGILELKQYRVEKEMMFSQEVKTEVL